MQGDSRKSLLLEDGKGNFRDHIIWMDRVLHKEKGGQQRPSQTVRVRAGKFILFLSYRESFVLLENTKVP